MKGEIIMYEKRVLDVSELAIKGEQLKKAILNYLGVEDIIDELPELFTIGYFLRECYDCIGKIIDFNNEFVIRVDNLDDELKFREMYAVALSGIDGGIRLLKGLADIREVAKEMFGFKVIEDDVVNDIYSNILLSYRELVTFEYID